MVLSPSEEASPDRHIYYISRFTASPPQWRRPLFVTLQWRNRAQPLPYVGWINFMCLFCCLNFLKFDWLLSKWQNWRLQENSTQAFCTRLHRWGQGASGHQRWWFLLDCRAFNVLGRSRCSSLDPVYKHRRKGKGGFSTVFITTTCIMKQFSHWPLPQNFP